MVCPLWLRGGATSRSIWRTWIVLRCPECSAEIDVDEDEVEEGEILSCPECEAEIEVAQTHPVRLNAISDEDEDEDEDEEKEDEPGDAEEAPTEAPDDDEEEVG